MGLLKETSSQQSVDEVVGPPDCEQHRADMLCLRNGATSNNVKVLCLCNGITKYEMDNSAEQPIGQSRKGLGSGQEETSIRRMRRQARGAHVLYQSVPQISATLKGQCYGKMERNGDQDRIHKARPTPD